MSEHQNGSPSPEKELDAEHEKVTASIEDLGDGEPYLIDLEKAVPLDERGGDGVTEARLSRLASIVMAPGKGEDFGVDDGASAVLDIYILKQGDQSATFVAPRGVDIEDPRAGDQVWYLHPGQKISLGRRPQADDWQSKTGRALPSTISNDHVMIEMDAEGKILSVADQGSTNGTFMEVVPVKVEATVDQDAATQQPGQESNPAPESDSMGDKPEKNDGGEVEATGTELNVSPEDLALLNQAYYDILQRPQYLQEGAKLEVVDTFSGLITHFEGQGARDAQGIAALIALGADSNPANANYLLDVLGRAEMLSGDDDRELHGVIHDVMQNKYHLELAGQSEAEIANSNAQIIEGRIHGLLLNLDSEGIKKKEKLVACIEAFGAGATVHDYRRSDVLFGEVDKKLRAQ